MRTGKSFVWAAAFALVIAFALTTAASAQVVKMGFVKDADIQAGYKAWQRAQEQWDLEQKAWNDEAQAKEEELQTLLDEYDQQKLILSEEKRREREAAIRAKREALDAYTRQIYGPGGTAEKKNEDLTKPLYENITKAIEAVAVEEGYDVIFTMQSGLGYINPAYDVTQKVLDKLEEIE
jgi:outer membrane protein